MPVRAVFCVRQLGVETHDGGEELGKGQDEEAREERPLHAAGRGAGGGVGFALRMKESISRMRLASDGVRMG